MLRWRVFILMSASFGQFATLSETLSKTSKKLEKRTRIAEWLRLLSPQDAALAGLYSYVRQLRSVRHTIRDVIQDEQETRETDQDRRMVTFALSARCCAGGSLFLCPPASVSSPHYPRRYPRRARN